MGRRNLVVVGVIVAIGAALLWVGSRGAGSRPPSPSPATSGGQGDAPSPATQPGSPPEPNATGAMVGRLVRGNPPEPVAGRVTIGSREVTIDADGHFRVEGLLRGEPLALTAEASGLATLRIPGLRIGPSGTFDVGDIRLGLPQEVRVLVTGPLSEPVSGARVTLHPAPRLDVGRGGPSSLYEVAAPIHPAVASLTTGEFGTAAIPDAPPGAWLVRATAEGLAEAVLPLTVREGGASEPLRFRLAPGAELCGKVLDQDGKPVSGARIRITLGGFEKSSAVSGEMGEYSFDRLPLGELFLWWFPSQECERGLGSVHLPVQGEYDIRLPAVACVAGLVVDEASGRPVAGACVSYEAQILFSDESSEWVHAKATTDADGEFVLEGLSPDLTGELSVVKEGYVPFPADGQASPDVALHAATHPGAPLRLPLRRGVEIRGRVIDSHGAPVPTARVSARHIIGQPSVLWGLELASRTPAVRTDSDGRFVLDGVPPGRALLFAEAEGFVQPAAKKWHRAMYFDSSEARPSEELVIEVPEAGGTIRDIVLARSATVTGTVVDEDGYARAGCRVSVRAEEDDHRGEVTLGESEPTDARGRFVVTGLVPGGRGLAEASSPDGGQGTSPVFDLKAGQRIDGIRVVITKGATPIPLEGSVFFADGSPVAGAQVVAVLHPKMYPARLLRQTAYGVRTRFDAPSGVTDPDGRFGLEVVSKGEYLLVVRGVGVAADNGHEATVRRAERQSGILITVPRGRAIEGVVLDERGDPISGAEVQISPGERWRDAPARRSTSLTRSFSARLEPPTRTTTASTDGRFRMDGLGDGEYWVVGFAEDHLEGWTRAVAGARGVTVRLGRALSIAGRVEDAATGEPVAGVLVNFRAPEDDRFSGPDKGTLTATDGSFRIGGLGPGEFTLYIGFDRDERDIEWVETSVRSVTAGTLDLHVPLQRGLAVAGRVIDQFGRPVSGTVGHFRREERAPPGSRSWGMIRADADGRFRVPGLLPGAHSAFIYDDPAEPGRLLVETVVKGVVAGEQAVTLHVVRGLTISGRVVGPDGEPIRHGVPGIAKLVVTSRRPEGETESGGWKSRELYQAFDSDGEGTGFETMPLMPGRKYDLVVSGFAGGPVGVARDVEAGARDIVIRLQKPLTIEGRLIESGGGRVPAGMLVWAKKVDGSGGPGERGSARSAADGGFRIEGLVEGLFEITVDLSRAIYRTPETPLRVPAGSRGHVIGLTPGAAISGRVVDAAGEPVAWSKVGISGGPLRALCEHDGTFLLGGLEPGEVSLRVKTRAGVEFEAGVFKVPSAGIVIRLPRE